MNQCSYALIVCTAFKAQADVIKGAEAALDVEVVAFREAATTCKGRAMLYDVHIIVRELLEACVDHQPLVGGRVAIDLQKVQMVSQHSICGLRALIAC